MRAPVGADELKHGFTLALPCEEEAMAAEEAEAVMPGF